MNDKSDRTATDRRVSDTYRELANERAPQALNDKVLRMAAGAKPVRSLIPGPWMKPVAWAATIGLSLAIVLELTQVPQIPSEFDGVSPALTAEEPAIPTPTGIESSPETLVDERQDRQLQTEKSAIAQPSPVMDSRERVRERRDVKPEVHRAERAVVEEAAAPAMTRAPELLETAATVTDEAAADADGAISPAGNATASSMAAPAERMLMAAPLLCPADARESAEDWYRCIETNRAVSPAEAIEKEIAALREQFPDFPIPDADK
jgi:hypothetical protein